MPVFLKIFPWLVATMEILTIITLRPGDRKSHNMIFILINPFSQLSGFIHGDGVILDETTPIKSFLMGRQKNLALILISNEASFLVRVKFSKIPLPFTHTQPLVKSVVKDDSSDCGCSLNILACMWMRCRSAADPLLVRTSAEITAPVFAACNGIVIPLMEISAFVCVCQCGLLGY